MRQRAAGEQSQVVPAGAIGAGGTGTSKKWENHEAAMALFFAYYNFCRVHGTIKMTPAQKSGLTVETWSLERLLAEASRV